MTLHYEDDTVTLHHGHALAVAGTLQSSSVQTIVTSPPYFGLRDYGEAGQIGGEASLADYVESLRELFSEMRRVLSDDGVLWLNLGDTYSGRANAGPAYDGNRGRGRPGAIPKRKRTTSDAPYKSLLGAPWRVAFALMDDGWVLRSEVIWAKPNPMPESVLDRPTRSHEQLFMLTKGPRYYYDAAAIAEPAIEAGRIVSAYPDAAKVHQTGPFIRNRPGLVDRAVPALRNKRDVWEIAPAHFGDAHFAVMPDALARPCILSSSRPGDVVLDPFSGSGTTGMVATQEGRKYVGIDLNADYLDLSLRTRFHAPSLNLYPAAGA
jgi:DNA modification methylase